jgi:protoporphyrinogen IX oxidase
MAWLMVFHIFGVVFWLGGLLIVTSMAGHVADEVGVARERLLMIARRLFMSACNVGLAVTLIFGIALLAWEPELLKHGWLHVKLLLVLILIVIHIRLARRLGKLVDDPASATRKEFMMLHGIVSLILLAILILVVVKPF